MSRFVVNLTDNETDPSPVEFDSGSTIYGSPKPEKRRRRWPKVLAIFAIVLVTGCSILGIGGYFYWRSLIGTPQYSLALIVEAAKNDDKQSLDKMVNYDAVVDDFVPQVTKKAVELYGKGLPPTIIAQLGKIAAPVLPAVKERARAELPRIVRERVANLGNVPFFAMVIGAGQYLDIKVDGENATVTSKLPEHPLELKMHRNGNNWQIVGVRDDNLATDIAKKIGQDIIAIAMNGGAKKTADKLGAGSIADLIKKAGDLLK